jgi:hypothetical protein
LVPAKTLGGPEQNCLSSDDATSIKAPRQRPQREPDHEHERDGQHKPNHGKILGKKLGLPSMKVDECNRKETGSDSLACNFKLSFRPAEIGVLIATKQMYY